MTRRRLVTKAPIRIWPLRCGFEGSEGVAVERRFGHPLVSAILSFQPQCVNISLSVIPLGNLMKKFPNVSQSKQFLRDFQ